MKIEHRGDRRKPAQTLARGSMPFAVTFLRRRHPLSLSRALQIAGLVGFAVEVRE